MKTFALVVPAHVEITPAMIREALGPDTMAAAKRILKEEDRADLMRIARKSSVAAYSDGVAGVVKAYGRYEASKGTRDERRALAGLEAACAGLRAADRNLKKMAAIVDPAETTLAEKENRA